MQVINVEVYDIKVFSLVERVLYQKHMMGEGVDTGLSQSKRSLAYRHQTGFRERVAAGEKRNLMSLPYELFGETGNYSFGPAIEFWRNALIEWRDLGNSHGRQASFCIEPQAPISIK